MVFNCTAVLFNSGLLKCQAYMETEWSRQTWWRSYGPETIEHRYAIIAAAWRVHKEKEGSENELQSWDNVVVAVFIALPRGISEKQASFSGMREIDSGINNPL